MKKALIVLLLLLLAAVLIVSCDDNKGASLAPVSNPGDTITLGNVKWEALWVEAENKSAYLISQDVLEVKLFDNDDSCDYANSDIHTYLNGDFISNNGLSTSYMKKANLSDVNITDDCVFLPSEAEINAYLLRPEDRIANYNGVAKNWWLRTLSDGKVRFVGTDGNINYQLSANTPNIGVRPAFWYTWN